MTSTDSEKSVKRRSMLDNTKNSEMMQTFDLSRLDSILRQITI